MLLVLSLGTRITLRPDDLYYFHCRMFSELRLIASWRAKGQVKWCGVVPLVATRRADHPGSTRVGCEIIEAILRSAIAGFGIMEGCLIAHVKRGSCAIKSLACVPSLRGNELLSYYPLVCGNFSSAPIRSQ